MRRETRGNYRLALPKIWEIAIEFELSSQVVADSRLRHVIQVR